MLSANHFSDTTPHRTPKKNVITISDSDHDDDDHGAEPIPVDSPVFYMKQMKTSESSATKPKSSSARIRLPPRVTKDFLRGHPTVNELVSVLSEAGVDLPGKREKRDFYLRLFATHLLPLLSEQPQASARDGKPGRSNLEDSSPQQSTPSRPSFIDFAALATPTPSKLPFSRIQDPIETCDQNSEEEEQDTRFRRQSAWDTLEPALSPRTPTENTPPTSQPRRIATPLPKKRFVPPYSVKRSRRRQGYATELLVATGLAYITFAIVVYLQCWDQIGYRVAGAPPQNILFTGSSMDTVLPYVIPNLSKICPPGAVCNGKDITCVKEGFVVEPGILARTINALLPHHWSFVIPFVGVPQCVPDGSRMKQQLQVENLVAYLNDIVRKWSGHIICGSADRKQLHISEQDVLRSAASRGIYGLPVSAGKRFLRELVGSRWTEEKFEEYWKLVMYKLAAGAPESSGPTENVEKTLSQKSPLFTVVDEGTGGRHRLLVSENAPQLPAVCSARLQILKVLQLHWLPILVTGVGLCATTILYIRHLATTRDAQVVGTIVEDVLDALYSESENHRVDPVRFPLPGLSVAHVRDHFLHVTFEKQSPAWPSLNTKKASSGSSESRDGDGITAPLDSYGFAAILDENGRTRWVVSDGYTKDKIWKDVQVSVLKNSCVRETVMEVNGEEDCVWQWIGSAALSPKKRKMVGERNLARSE